MKRTVLDALEFFAGLGMVVLGAGFFDWRVGLIAGGTILLATSIIPARRGSD